jgi:hypothetical protein
MILSEELAFWVEVLALALSTILSGTAAYYAYKQYNKRPKLEFYLQNEEYDPISYDTQRGTADVYCWLANVGKVAAHNVHGWLVYGDDPGGIWPETDEDSGVIDSTDNAATVYLERLMPNPPQGAPTFFIDSPKLFCFPVTVWKAGPVILKYRFVCAEGASTEGTLALYFANTTAP